MKHHVTETIPAREHQRTTHTTCDLCGAASPQSDSWGQRSCDVNEVTVSHRTGASWPDGGETQTTRVDLCPTCFTSKLLPWLAAQGAKPSVESADW